MFKMAWKSKNKKHLTSSTFIQVHKTVPDELQEIISPIDSTSQILPVYKSSPSSGIPFLLPW